MRGIILCVILFFGPCLFGEETALKGDLNEDGVADAVDTVLLANYQVGNLDTLYAAGDVYQVDSIVGVLRYVPAGTFQQGKGPDDPCDYIDDEPFTHTLTANLAVMETEVTRLMWAALQAWQETLPADPTDTNYGAGMNNPVQCVTWYEAVLFANLLSVVQGFTRCYYTDAAFTVPIDATNYQTDDVYCDWSADGYRLPTEGEWEYFCRAGTTTPFSVAEPAFTACNEYCTLGDLPALESVAWYCANQTDPLGNNTSKPVGLKGGNPWGLKDVHGNVGELCWDWRDTYPTGPVTDYRCESSETSTKRVTRNAGWYNRARLLRSSIRGSKNPYNGSYDVGFRLCRSVD